MTPAVHRIAVLAAGAWGTALAVAFAARHPVTLWARETEVAEDIRANRENRRFLPGCPIPPGVSVITEFPALSGFDLVIVATPVAGLRATLQQVAAQGVRIPLLWVCKGFEQGSGLLPHQVATAELGADYPWGALSGPSFAEEVAKGLPTAITLAARPLARAREWVACLHTGRLRLYASEDVVGVEVGGAVKNVLAIATGIADGLNLGLNARAALVTRGLAEIARLGKALGGEAQTFMGLAGVGDLLLTCTGDLSRNRRVGLALGRGQALPQILADLGHVAEGVSTALEVHRLACSLGVEMPITAAVAAVLEGRLPPLEAVEQLLSRDPKVEGL